MEDINDGYMYGDEGFGYIQDAEILDRPDLFYGPPGSYKQYLVSVAQFLPPANEVWGKVIFSEACVKNSVHMGRWVSQHPPRTRYTPPPWSRHLLRPGTPPRE